MEIESKCRHRLCQNLKFRFFEKLGFGKVRNRDIKTWNSILNFGDGNSKSTPKNQKSAPQNIKFDFDFQFSDPKFDFEILQIAFSNSFRISIWDTEIWNRHPRKRQNLDFRFKIRNLDFVLGPEQEFFLLRRVDPLQHQVRHLRYNSFFVNLKFHSILIFNLILFKRFSQNKLNSRYPPQGLEDGRLFPWQFHRHPGNVQARRWVLHRHVPPQGFPSLVHRWGYGWDGIHWGRVWRKIIIKKILFQK